MIARVHGMATAAGCQLVAACDLAVAAESARFATPGVRIGLFCSTPMVPLSRAVGRKRALEMLLTGEPIDAATARDWGLVNRVVPDDELDGAVAALVDADRRVEPADAARSARRRSTARSSWPRATPTTLTREVMARNAEAADAQEGMGAFLEKRAPRWSGR